jgi:endoglucanase
MLDQIPPGSKRMTTFNPSVFSLGLYPGGCSIEEYEHKLGVKFNHILMFQNINRLNYARVTEQLDKGYTVILTITFRENYANLKDVRNGAYDGELEDLIDKIKDDGREIWIRPLHEFNGDWDSWDVFYRGNSTEDFIPAWKHVVTLFREKNAPVKFQIDYNRISAKGDDTPFSEFYPGDEWVDMVVVSCYNRAFTDKAHNSWRTFRDQFRNAYDQVTHMTQKPIGIAELGSVSYGGDKPQWIIDAFKSIYSEFTRVREISWFLNNKRFSDTVCDWDLNTPQEIAAFKQAISILLKGEERPK